MRLVLPRVFARALADPSRHGAVVRTSHPTSKLLAGHAAAFTGGGLTDRAAGAAAHAVSALLVACAPGPRREAATALAGRLMERIAADMASPEPPPARLAAALGVSPATHNRAVGGSAGIAALVRECRLDRVFALISSPERGDVSLGSAARMVGFSGADQLRRLFLARFGQRTAQVAAARRGEPAAADGGRIAAWKETLGRSGQGAHAEEPTVRPRAFER